MTRSVCFIAAALAATAAPALAQECPNHVDITMTTGTWKGEAETGVFARKSPFKMPSVIPMLGDSTTLLVEGGCEGTIRLQWNDETSGHQDWTLYRIGRNKLAPKTKMATPHWTEFVAVSPELQDSDDYYAFYYARQSIIMPKLGQIPAEMVLAYKGDPGRGGISGKGSITMRFGPIVVRGLGTQTMWARSGKARFTRILR